MSKQFDEYSKEELLELVKNLKKSKQFGLVWEDKPENVVKECEQKLPVLDEIIERKITQNADSTPTHVLIEGDNYHSLSSMNYTHADKIDVIYIDPPYNTGNKDFIYNDRFVDKEDSFRHSKWLSFMEKRLKLARKLLSDSGIIFISIDDNEQAHLKILCDHIFGEKNMIANLVWQNKEGGGKSDSKHFRSKHEYILCYAKNATKAIIYGQPVEDAERYKLSDKHEQTRGKYQLIKLDSGSLGWISSLDYPIELNGKTFYAGGDKEKWQDRQNGGTSIQDCGWRWRWGQDKLRWGLENDFVVTKGDNIYTKQYLNVDRDGNIINGRKIQPIGVIDGFSTTQANRLVKEMFGKVSFNYSKPIDLIVYLLKLSTHESSTILDFFAGSGTTGHAVMKLNKEDGGNRQFILCTNNENGIAENITYQRLKKVVDGYGEGTKKVEGIPANLRYFCTSFVEKDKCTDTTRTRLVARCADMIRIRENTFNTVADTDECKFYSSSKIFTAIVFDPFKIAKIWQEIESKNIDKLPVKLYVFSYSRDTSAFTDEIPETNLIYESVPIPESILQVYKRLFKEKGGKR